MRQQSVGQLDPEAAAASHAQVDRKPSPPFLQPSHQQRVLLVVGEDGFRLQHLWRHLAARQRLPQMAASPVAHPNLKHTPIRLQPLERAPRLLPQLPVPLGLLHRVDRPGEVDEEQVELLRPQTAH
eukprot:CAMPEP_0182834700 /NCGR_PEP_ID=MMETSP0006_2-20121128/21069_1 /TAXON_ID=97485 /ORGANISM="Prymnesium parvum, Strain Texoma1" /LENGTH=125 /DNA_ID=CAMNT_0024962993 /DNA_START=253 /DNA_END=631 /DNA_ORIENTATION=-